MLRRKLAPDLIRGGHRFADKNMRQVKRMFRFQEPVLAMIMREKVL
jgi:hypothetical protein